MVQSAAEHALSLVADGLAGDGAPLGRRERNRLARHRSYLRTAMRLVHSEGLDGLTMQRVADELDCAVGTIYTYFPSKSALVAEVQREAIERLTGSYLVARERLDRRIADDGLDPETASLARVVAMGRFWAATTETFPEEAHLLQLLMSESRGVIDEGDGARNLPAAMRHLDHARLVLAEAETAGSISPADIWERVVMWVAAVNGVVQTSRLAAYDADLFDGLELSARLNSDLIRGWGADPVTLAAAERLIDELAASGPLAPTIADPEEHQ